MWRIGWFGDYRHGMDAWTTLTDLATARIQIAASMPGFVPPEATAIGFVPDGEDPSAHHFPVVNTRDRLLPGVVAASVLGYRSGTRTIEVSEADLLHIIDMLAPAEACHVIEHPNLRLWRDTILVEVQAGRPGRILAVFIGDLDDAASSPADVAVRAVLRAQELSS